MEKQVSVFITYGEYFRRRVHLASVNAEIRHTHYAEDVEDPPITSKNQNALSVDILRLSCAHVSIYFQLIF